MKLNMHPKRIEAARTRRKRGQQPMPWDNPLLSRNNEVTNSLPVRAPRVPEPGSELAKALTIFLRQALSASVLATKINVTEPQARNLIGELRANGWWIENDGDGRFFLVSHKAAA